MHHMAPHTNTTTPKHSFTSIPTHTHTHTHTHTSSQEDPHTCINCSIPRPLPQKVQVRTSHHSRGAYSLSSLFTSGMTSFCLGWSSGASVPTCSEGLAVVFVLCSHFCVYVSACVHMCVHACACACTCVRPCVCKRERDTDWYVCMH